jgi:excisionase family DNA binding protein
LLSVFIKESRRFLNLLLPLNNSLFKAILLLMGIIGTKKASEILHLSKQRIHALIKENRLPAIKLGRDYAINEDDLKFVKNRLNGRPKKTMEINK